MNEHENERDRAQRSRVSLDVAIAQELPGVVVTGWVCVVEVMDPAGGAQLGMLSSEGMTPWRARGMMQCEHDVLAPAPQWSYEDEGEA